MSCTDFENKVTDLVGDRLMEATMRRRLQGHAEECAACAARLEAERLLTRRLATLAEQTENEEADPALKNDLLAAFVKLHATDSGPVLHEVPRRPQPRYWLLAAAAALIAAFAGITAFYLRTPVPNQLASASQTPLVQASPDVTPVTIPDKVTEPLNAKASGNAPTETRTDTRIAKRVRRSTRTAASTEIASVSREETTTDYLPLTYSGDQTTSGVVVRVEIPRSTLLAMGLPMNSERGNTLVKADVVVGDDGVPRAIRLVQ
jgi:hypothetical protein